MNSSVNDSAHNPQNGNNVLTNSGKKQHKRESNYEAINLSKKTSNKIYIAPSVDRYMSIRNTNEMEVRIMEDWMKK